jgi:hypothetical protein
MADFWALINTDLGRGVDLYMTTLCLEPVADIIIDLFRRYYDVVQPRDLHRLTLLAAVLAYEPRAVAEYDMISAAIVACD